MTINIICLTDFQVIYHLDFLPDSFETEPQVNVISDCTSEKVNRSERLMNVHVE
jgi:hypothetical protein